MPATAPQSVTQSWQLWCAALSGCLLLAAAFPPFDLPAVAWFAPVPWLWLIGLPQLPGKRPYLAIWLCGFLFWAWMLQGIRLAHPALIAGWLALSAYLAVYLPLFIGMTRKATLGWKIPLVIAAPIVWVGLEVIRAHFLTGFALGIVGHTQTFWPTILQVASLGGAYAVSFVVVTFSAGLFDAHYRWWQDRSVAASAWRLVYTALVIFAAVWWGHSSLHRFAHREQPTTPPAKIVLVQGSLDTVFEFSPERVGQTIRQYRELTTQAKEKYGSFDLIVWPESSCPLPYLQCPAGYCPPAAAQMSAEDFAERVKESNRHFENMLSDVADEINAESAAGNSDSPQAKLLLGTSIYAYSLDADFPDSFNTALWTNADGEVAGNYHKMHPVMFGEYIPLADWFPILYKITPMSGGLTSGKQPETLTVAGYRVSPSICFESTVPHLIRRQVAQLRQRGEEPDILINVTNDGWFWGSSILDLHLRCAIFRAVELRKPMLVAANTGISAWIDGNGVVRQQSPRRKTDLILAEVEPDGRISAYSRYGDLFGWLCAVLPLATIICSGYRLLAGKKKLTHKQ